MKKIVVMTASPRKGGNSFCLAESFISAAKSAGYDVTRIDTAFCKAAGCRACNSCFTKGRPCVFEDDFNAAAEAILACDGLVIVSPVYWYTFPSHIKSFIDRLYSLCVAGKDLSGKKCALIACCGDEGADTFDGMLFSYKKTMELLKCESVGEVLVPGVNDIGDIGKTDGCARAARLAGLF